jgi:hypothetical protein
MDRPVDVLLCFSCADVAIFDSHRAGAPRPVDMHAAEETFLRLAAVELPDFAALKDNLKAEQTRQAHQALFLSLLPADVQVAFTRRFGFPTQRTNPRRPRAR